jgi:hypothetical protein
MTVCSRCDVAHKLPVHPLARAIPPMTDREFVNFKADVREKGQLKPITLYESSILDGIHRQCACFQLGIAPTTEDYLGPSPAGFVISVNVKRRHLQPEVQDTLTATALIVHYRYKYPKQGGADVAKVAQDLGLTEVPEKSGTTDNTSPVVRLVARAVVGSEESPRALMQRVEVYQTLTRQAPALAKEVAAGTKALYAADAERKQLAKVSAPSRSGVTPKGQARDTALDEYLAAIRLVGVKQNVLVTKRRELTGHKDFLAGAQDKLERVTAAGKRIVESL